MRADSIESGEAFGTTELIRGWLLEMQGIPSAEAFGNTRIPSPPQFDAVGAGRSQNTFFETSISYSHNGTQSAYLIVDVCVGSPCPGLSVTYAGTAMTQLAVVEEIGAFTLPGQFYRFGLANIPGGTHTVFVELNRSSVYVASNSVSYLNVSSISAVEKTDVTIASTSQPTHEIDVAAAEMAVQAFAGRIDSSGGFRNHDGGNLRYNALNSVSPLSIMDSEAPTTFEAEVFRTDQYWVSVVHKLIASILVVEPTGIASDEAFGTAKFVVATDEEIAPTGIASAQAFGTANVGIEQFVTANDIESAEAFGTAKTRMKVTPTGASSAEAFGSAEVAKADVLAIDALGEGSVNNTATPSWSHTATEGADVFVAISVNGNTSVFAISSVTYGGVAMTKIAQEEMNNLSTQGRVELWRLTGVAGGAATVSVTFNNAPSGSGATCQSISFVNVASVGSAQLDFGDGSFSHGPITVDPGQIALQVFGGNNVGADKFSGLSGGTNHYNNGFVLSGDYRSALAVNTADETTTFTTTDGGPWAGIAVVIS
ncbi:hypothetical protein CQY20_26130 [Mycolicibacterium agri]|nr:hypothetical protein CQY20_26130 [Mycolicibacterium agri]